MIIEVGGRTAEIDRYRRLISACLEHFDRLTVSSPWRHREMIDKTFGRPTLEAARVPSSDWIFILTFEDIDFAMWFKLKYL